MKKYVLQWAIWKVSSSEICNVCIYWRMQVSYLHSVGQFSLNICYFHLKITQPYLRKNPPVCNESEHEIVEKMLAGHKEKQLGII